MSTMTRENDSPETLKRRAINKQLHQKGVKRGGKVRNKVAKKKGK